MEIDKDTLIRNLESVSAGLSPREVIEQSSCFVFKDGQVQTFNDEICCTAVCMMQVTGAVSAAPLLSLLKKIPDETITAEQTDSELVIMGKRRKAGLRMEKEILLPVDNVETPKDSGWQKLSETFADAIGVVCGSISNDQNRFSLTCIHIHPEWIESCDGFQLTRCTMSTGVAKSILVRGKAMRQVGQLGMIEFCETGSWIHFRNDSGLVLSVRKYVEEYPDLSGLLSIDGVKTELPKGIVEAAEIAEIFSADNVDQNQVSVELGRGRVRVKGESTSGWYSETRKMKESVQSVKFMIDPKLLKEIVKHPTCEIQEGKAGTDDKPTIGRLKVVTELFEYVTCLGSVEK
uniref:DNA polymerase n=1 Tax=viral metagenome TaxID=1070528 RepID=A0A6M3IQV9_9ZZZZ